MWALFSAQLLLIGIFVLFGTFNSSSHDSVDNSYQAYRLNDLPSDRPRKFVQFVTNKFDAKNARPMHPVDMPDSSSTHHMFHDAYFECRTGKAMNFTTDELFCFRNSSIRPVSPHLRKFVDSLDDDDEPCTCKCQEGYHGRDCSQPEVIWRAFMTHKLSQTKYVQSMEPTPQRIYYFIDASALSLTTVEIQFLELHDSIDFLILCDEIRNNTNAVHSVSSRAEKFQYHQVSGEHDNEFFLNKLKRKILILDSKEKCSLQQSYKLFRNHVSTMGGSKRLKANDILLFSSVDEILSRSAIEYLKWNSYWLESQSIRFRLKYNVYGFYWQHPDRTVVGSAACQLHMLEKRYHNNVSALMNSTSDSMIIGDLNHYGGWFCQYCYESTDNIMQKIQRDRMIDPKYFDAMLPAHDDQKDQRQALHRYDSTSIESLISAGVYIDGKLELIRLHRYSEKCYAPNRVNRHDLKYQSMLTNTYAHYDNVVDE